MNDWYEALDEVVGAVDSLSVRGVIVLIGVCSVAMALGFCIGSALLR